MLPTRLVFIKPAFIYQHLLGVKINCLQKKWREPEKITDVPVHVERVTCLVRRKYTRLQGILPIQLVTARKNDDLAPVDKISIICCALNTLSVYCASSSKYLDPFGVYQYSIRCHGKKMSGDWQLRIHKLYGLYFHSICSM